MCEPLVELVKHTSLETAAGMTNLGSDIDDLAEFEQLGSV